MNILVVGSGGREHTLCWKISQSQQVNKIYCAPGNGGTSQVAENIDIGVEDIEELRDFALDNNVDLTIVGPEVPLVLGIVDSFKEKGLKVFGANQKAAQLEGSKEFSKSFMIRNDVSTARYQSFNNYDDAVAGLDSFDYPLVIKADGLCAGKGVIICEDRDMAIETLDDILNDEVFGEEGSSVVIEEFLDGIEASLLCFVSGNKIIPMESAKDYKQIYDNDKGPNTGGVGCYSPSPLFTDDLNERIDKDVIEKIEKGLTKDGLEFTGILFIGFMIVDGEPKVLEFNVRFGDPEAEVVLPRLKNDLIEVLEKTMDGRLERKDLDWDERACLTVLLTSKAYPGECETGFPIEIDESIDDSIILFHNGTRLEENKYLTNGGRVMSVTTLAKDVLEAREIIYRNIDKVQFDGVYHRTDIGKI